MGNDAVRRFLQEVEQDEILQTEVGQAMGSASDRSFVSDRCAALAHVAADHGYNITADDVRAASETENEPA